jgi:hypothetical protein
MPLFCHGRRFGENSGLYSTLSMKRRGVGRKKRIRFATSCGQHNKKYSGIPKSGKIAYFVRSGAGFFDEYSADWTQKRPATQFSVSESSRG